VTIRDVAREARTALDSILGYSEILEEDLKDLSPASRDDLDRIREATIRVLTLVTLLEAQVDSAREEASRDPLTGAANRRTLVSHGEVLFQADTALSLLLIDVDRFKEVNDQYGHLVGDEVLKILVERCRSSSRETDLVARFAGDEFVILLPGTPLAEAERVAERLLKHITGTPFLTDVGPVPIAVSVGVTERGAADGTMEQLLRRADEAMYSAKQRGGSRVARL
jgi:diguanylate cyclase